MFFNFFFSLVRVATVNGIFLRPLAGTGYQYCVADDFWFEHQIISASLEAKSSIKFYRIVEKRSKCQHLSVRWSQMHHQLIDKKPTNISTDCLIRFDWWKGVTFLRGIYHLQTSIFISIGIITSGSTKLKFCCEA